MNAKNVNLLTDTLSSVLDEGEYIIDFPLNKIRINPQVRRKYKPEKVEQIAASIKLHGQIEPCILTEPDDEGMADLLVGFTRFYANQKNESPTLKAVLRPAPENLRVVQMSENMHREDLDIVDTALGVVELNVIDKLKPKDICEQLGVNNSWVSKMLAIGKLPLELLDDVTSLTTDIETFYILAGVYKKSPDLAYDVVEAAKVAGELKRTAVKDAQAKLKNGGVDNDSDGADNGTDNGTDGADNGTDNGTGGADNGTDGAGDGTGGADNGAGSDDNGTSTEGSGKNKIPGQKKNHQVIVSFLKDGVVTEGSLITNQESIDGAVCVVIDGKDNLVAIEELKLVRIVYA
ncbi:TPA: ParB/RepB/Spo0J family partition protein [Citrobacter freundii]|uniref:ParB/RepB/Spo0J family partition protein n=1 Tax=Citrobacter TaxID=544 RepID=UPI000847AB2C|nr:MULTISPECIES: ParB/RepB/Spo0J family partition protein [Citrobacter]MBA7999386.1 ParB/RepB/Spo0J family partition protein [Citrobacter freundii]HAT2815085.1 ParB/RepB/Spo0J family partition protein [Citrobacter freundii]HAU4305962.1 ParB/RepB/Spo0J family partition protein [Citrobacter freundii]HAU5694700.1 ParB/RepB/Spo0J family partition protein [Citrobacter freundii]HBB6887109.1 ParB/RepB/Spo0J family partition protein [Citrobacter freundii]